MMWAQLAIAFTGVIAIALTQFGSAWGRKVACLFGLAAQPFWLFATISAEQWGMVAICCLYTAVWGWSVWKQWVQPRWFHVEHFQCPGCVRRDVPRKELIVGAFFLFHHCGHQVRTAQGKLADTGDLK